MNRNGTTIFDTLKILRKKILYTDTRMKENIFLNHSDFPAISKLTQIILFDEKFNISKTLPIYHVPNLNYEFGNCMTTQVELKLE